VSVSAGICWLGLSSNTVGACISTNPHGGAKTGFQFEYGFVEWRAAFPGVKATVDNWCAVWSSSQDWPSTGEIDIAESLGGSLTSNYHSGGPSGGAVNVPNNSGPIAGNWGGTFHTYGVHRKVGVNDVYWDGVLVRSYETFDNGSPHYLIAVVGSGQGGPLVVPSVMGVDYCRVWNLT
jgi:beta-glucanase (GH16 family)